MENIKFDNELLNKYFAEQVGKDEYGIDELNNLYDFKREIDARKIGKNLTQHDLDILLSLKTISFRGIDFTNLKIENADVEKISFSGCDLTNVQFENNKAQKLQITYCDVTDNIMKQISNIQGVEEFSYMAQVKFSREKILADYPTFFELSENERREILQNPKYEIRMGINLDALSNFRELNTLKLEGVSLEENSLNFLEDLKKLERLEIVSSDLNENIIIPNNGALKDLTLATLKSFKILKNFASLTSLNIYQEENEYKDGEYLANCDVENLYLSGVKNVESVLPKSKEAKKVALINCDISDASQFLEYENLQSLRLDKSNIGVEQLEALAKISQRVSNITFAGTDAQKFLSEKVYVIENEEAAQKIKRIFGVWRGNDINEYDVFTTTKGTYDVRISGNEMLEALMDTGLINSIKTDKFELELQTLDDTMIDSITSLADRLKYLQISSFNGLTNENIQKLEGVNWVVDGDSLTNYFADTYYSSDDMKRILEVMEDIKEAIPENATELEKFLTVYSCIGRHADYDRSGCIGNENFVEGNEKRTRSLQGVLIDGKAVCRGYALALNYCLDYVGVDSKIVSGYAYGNPDNGHAWNQVKIDDNWYNVDLTWDYRAIRAGKELKDCLKSDKVFYETHTVTTEAEICDLDYDTENIQVGMRKVQGKDRYDELVAEIEAEIREKENSKTLVTTTDLRSVAIENPINQSTLYDLKQIMENKIESPKEREAIPEK